MTLYICGLDFHYETENLCRVFFPNEKITVSDTLPESGRVEVETYLEGAPGEYTVRVCVNIGDKPETRCAGARRVRTRYGTRTFLGSERCHRLYPAMGYSHGRASVKAYAQAH